jgi:hypothetical protein
VNTAPGGRKQARFLGADKLPIDALTGPEAAAVPLGDERAETGPCMQILAKKLTTNFVVRPAKARLRRPAMSFWSSVETLTVRWGVSICVAASGGHVA